MTGQSTSLIIVLLLIAFTAVFVSYMSAGNSSTAVQPSFAEQQTDVVKLKKEIALLEQRVNFLYEHKAEPRRYKELP